MGAMCQECYSQQIGKDETINKTIQMKSGPQMKGLKFTLSTGPLTRLNSQCLIVYGDHCSELNQSPPIFHLNGKIRRKLFQYITIADQSIQNKSSTHFITPISIHNLKFNYLLFVKLQPWNGKSIQQIQNKIYTLTKSYLEVFTIKNIKTFTIIQPDICLGIHYNLFYEALIKALKQYSKHIKKTTIIFNSSEAMNYFHQKINNTITSIENPLQNTTYHNKNTQKYTKSLKKNKLPKEEDKFIY